ncbi:hypothetical protein [Streptomyces sp. KL116D]|uniref:hypothetical protein n=1 Tax=Streptomyces sp. KL116D TaxID=3045152 RepID=UPI0035585C79
MDVRASKDVLRLKKFGSGCTNTADLVVVCDVGTRYDSWAGWSGALPYAAPGSKAGDTGRLRMTYEAPDGHVATATTRVVVGGPILEVRAPKVVGGIRPGAETSMDSGGAQHGRDHRPRRRPAADRRQRAAAVTALRELPLQRADRGAQTAYCTFPDLRSPPGRTVVFGPGLRMRTPRSSTTPICASRPGRSTSARVRSRAHDEPGTGRRRSPARTGECARAAGGAWSDDAEVWTMVHTDNPADYAAIGDRGGRAGRRARRADRRAQRRPGRPRPGRRLRPRLHPPRGSTVVKEPMQ